ncbi:histidine kinase [Novosphingobium sp.]|uniref:sensor histidine kinase n=1 Tax=Novosphingobium sp. TaxID=1874826 RepID=UPI00261BE81B|nr:histidine kinase [Novosphingobium sp.]
MNLRAAFENRSGRVIALFRAILVSVFLIVVLIEPVATASDLDRGKVLLCGYLVVSLLAVAVAWRSWWYDQRLAPGLLALDVTAFIAAVFVTETGSADFTSPFLALFALAILSATLRWDWRVASVTGVAATVLFVVVGLVIWDLGLPIDVYRFGRRSLYMLALLIVLVWFGVQRRDPHVARIDPGSDDPMTGTEDGTELRWRALEHAMAVTGARRGVLAWSEAEEPWLNLHEIRGGTRSHERLGPDVIVGWDEGGDEVRLFDRVRGRKLVRDADNLPHARTMQTPMALAGYCGITEGLTLPLRCVSGSGIIILAGLTGPGPDFVTIGAILAREISSAFDRIAVIEFEREALLSRTRGAIARDLHDSVAQSLAGACFRLEALRRQPDRRVLDKELVTVRDALRREQEHVRTLIDALRSPGSTADERDLLRDLRATAEDAAMHWNVAVTVSGTAATVPGWHSHELQQLLREAVANAARHGGAREVAVSLQRQGAGMLLDITDNGGGFALTGADQQPWSIRERVAALGGQLTVDSSPRGTHLAILLPVGADGADR